ncbi:urease accessory protein UreE [filamentous cyanobacterium LEGE 07170]|nr:urease accessory protein UreE [filamentous cyanobacterium LEGE 07170]
MARTPTLLTLTQRLTGSAVEEFSQPVSKILALTAEERTRSRHTFTAEDGSLVCLQLPRGTVLQDGDILCGTTGERVHVQAKAEPIYTVSAKTPYALLRATYHLGNRHVSLEIAPNYLRLKPDSVLKDMLTAMGLDVHESIHPFHPEAGAYTHRHSRTQHSHPHS